MEDEQFITDFAQSEIAPLAEQIDQDGRIPLQLISRLHEPGFLSVTLSKQIGGSGLNYLSLSRIVEEFSRVCGSTGALVSIHNCLYADLLARRATPQQIKQFLIPLNDTKRSLGAFALSESNAGSDVAAMTTRADKRGDRWILNGRKAWVTSARESEHAIIFATIDKEKFHRGITAFIVDLSSPGVTIERNEDKLGIRGTSTCSVSLEDVEVPLDNVLGGLGEGFKIAMSQLDVARLGIASQALGIAQAGLDVATAFLRQNLKFDQLTKMKLAEMAMRLEGARLMVRKAAGDREERTQATNTKYSSMAKVMASECATFNALSCVQLMAEQGVVKGCRAERLYRDSRITEIYGGITDIQKFIIADQVLKGN